MNQLEAVEAELGLIEYECEDRMEESDLWREETEKDTRKQVKALALASGVVASQGFSEIMRNEIIRIGKGDKKTNVPDMDIAEVSFIFYPSLN